MNMISRVAAIAAILIVAAIGWMWLTVRDTKENGIEAVDRYLETAIPQLCLDRVRVDSVDLLDADRVHLLTIHRPANCDGPVDITLVDQVASDRSFVALLRMQSQSDDSGRLVFDGSLTELAAILEAENRDRRARGKPLRLRFPEPKDREDRE